MEYINKKDDLDKKLNAAWSQLTDQFNNTNDVLETISVLVEQIENEDLKQKFKVELDKIY